MNVTPSIIQEIFKSLLSPNPLSTLRMELYFKTFVIVVQFVALIGLVHICIIVSTMRVRKSVYLSEFNFQ